MDWQPIAVYDRVNSRRPFEHLKHRQIDAFNPQTRTSRLPRLTCRLNGSTQHRRQISLLGFQIARSHVVVRLADELLCSDGLANAPTSRCPEESTVSAGHWGSRSTRAATGFADRKNRRRCWSPT